MHLTWWSRQILHFLYFFRILHKLLNFLFVFLCFFVLYSVQQFFHCMCRRPAEFFSFFLLFGQLLKCLSFLLLSDFEQFLLCFDVLTFTSCCCFALLLHITSNSSCWTASGRERNQSIVSFERIWVMDSAEEKLMFRCCCNRVSRIANIRSIKWDKELTWDRICFP